MKNLYCGNNLYFCARNNSKGMKEKLKGHSAMFTANFLWGIYNPQIQISEKSQTKRLKIADSRKTKRPIIDKRTTPNKRHSNAIITL